MSESTQKQCWNIIGYTGCSFFERSLCLARALKEIQADGVESRITEVGRKDWREFIEDNKNTLQLKESMNHNTSPFIFEGCHPGSYQFVGGFTDFKKTVEKRYNIKSDC